MEEDPLAYYDGVNNFTDEEIRRINAPARPFEVTWLRLKIFLRRQFGLI